MKQKKKTGLHCCFNGPVSKNLAAAGNPAGHGKRPVYHCPVYRDLSPDGCRFPAYLHKRACLTDGNDDLRFCGPALCFIRVFRCGGP